MRIHIAISIILWLGLAGACVAQTWERLSPEGGMVVSLATAQDGGIYLGTPDGHIFGSNDGGKRWELRGRVGNRTDAMVPRLLSDPRGTGGVFAAVWYQEPGAGGGVFRTEDAGRTWRLLGLAEEAVRALEGAPSKPDVLVAGTRSGVFRSEDAGKSWERISPPGDVELRNVDSVAIDPSDPNVIYAGTYHLPWKTTDGGKNWKPIVAGLIDDSDIMNIRVDTTDPARVYLSACSGIYRSENQGAEWTKLQGIPYAARRTHAIVQDPQNPRTLYAGTTEGLWLTRDGGENWKRTTPKDWVVNAVVVRPPLQSAPGRVFLGTEGQGVLASEDGGESFATANSGFTHVIVKQLLGDQWSETRRMLMVTERGGEDVAVSQDGGKSWTPVTSVGRSQEKNTNPGLTAGQAEEFYASPWGWMARLNGGRLWLWNKEQQNWKEWKPHFQPAARSAPRGPADQSKGAVSPVSLKLEGNAIAFSQESLFASTHDGVVRCAPSGICVKMRGLARVEAVRALWGSTNGERLAAVSDGRLALSFDGGATAIWRDLPAGIREARWIDVAGTPEGMKIFLGTNQGLFCSTDQGVTWSRQEEGLPAGQVEPWFRHDSLAVATLREGGIYLSQNAGASWTRVDRDAERGRASGIVEVRPGEWIVGSQSEGLLRLKVDDVR